MSDASIDLFVRYTVYRPEDETDGPFFGTCRDLPILVTGRGGQDVVSERIGSCLFSLLVALREDDEDVHAYMRQRGALVEATRINDRSLTLAPLPPLSTLAADAGHIAAEAAPDDPSMKHSRPTEMLASAHA